MNICRVGHILFIAFLIESISLNASNITCSAIKTGRSLYNNGAAMKRKVMEMRDDGGSFF